MRTLVSGTSSGLGAWLLKRFGASRYDRKSKPNGEMSGSLFPFDLIVHCASAMPTQDEGIEAYVSRLTSVCRALLSVPHRKFVFISSVDAAVIPQRNAYAVAKRSIEEVVFSSSPGAIVLRPGALFGPGMRPNQVLKVARGEDAVLTLGPKSRFSIVMYEDVAAAIEVVPPGTWHLMASRLVSLSEVAERFQTLPHWGTHTYETPDLPCDVPWNDPIPAIASEPLDRLAIFLQRCDGFKAPETHITKHH
jgi:uncharacterized protein YbjT (DUF2867 family)